MGKKIVRFIKLAKLSLCALRMKGDNEGVKKEHTISGIYRIKNAASSIELAILSVIDYLDEVVIVDNGSTDETISIVNKLQCKYKNKIRIYNYSNSLCRAGSGYLDRVKENPQGSLAKYYNYAFSLGSKEYLLKCDANYVFTKKGIQDIIHAMRTSPEVICFPGVEIFGHHHSMEPFLFKRSIDWKFEDGPFWEILEYERKIKIKRIYNPCFIHIKRLNYVKYIYSPNKGVEGIYGA